MSRRPFHPDELGAPSTDANTDANDVIAELESYAAITASDAPRGFQDRVMASLEKEPAPRRGLLAWLPVAATSGGGLGRFARVGALAATLVLAVAGALFVGQLADIVRNVGSGSPTPVPSVSPSPTQSESQSPSPSSPSSTPVTSPEASPSGSGHGSGGSGGSQQASKTPDASELETPESSGGKMADATNMP